MSVRYGLACSGGGALGAYQVGVLKFIHERHCRASRSPFSVFSGISCGSLNSTFLACRADDARHDILQLERHWLDFHVPEYHNDLVRSVLGAIAKGRLLPRFARDQQVSLFDPGPMDRIVTKTFDRPRLERCFREKTTVGLSVVATEIISGFPVWFSEGPAAVGWQRFHSLGRVERLSDRHVAASCSVPAFFPPVKLGEHYYLDGGVNLSRPLSGVLSLGATRILAIGTAAPRRQELPRYHHGYRPGALKVAKFVLSALTRDAVYEEVQQIATLNRIFDQIQPHLPKEGSTQSVPINAVFDQDFRFSDYEKVALLLITPSESLSRMFQQFNANKRRKTLVSRHEFMFHRDFLAELIDLGYRDAHARAQELADFFQPH